jgi:hypothetical protein
MKTSKEVEKLKHNHIRKIFDALNIPKTKRNFKRITVLSSDDGLSEFFILDFKTDKERGICQFTIEDNGKLVINSIL